MEKTSEYIAFGPVPSRRLGQSLGINNIPPKICTYSCVYCQVGRTRNMDLERKRFYAVDDIIRAVEQKIIKAGKKKETIDYLAFVPDGEPTLDVDLGTEIERLRSFGIKIGVITNASLINERSVKEDLCLADWVSVKIDTVTEDVWRTINRPNRSLDINTVLKGISEFSDMFDGELVTETLLVEGVNEGEKEIKKTADFISGLKSVKSYISIPTRPPAEKEVRPAKEHAVNRAYQIFTEKEIPAEYLIGYEGNAFAFTGDIKKDLLSIVSVHPMKEEAVIELLCKAGENREVLDHLISEGYILKVSYRNEIFYVRKI